LKIFNSKQREVNGVPFKLYGRHFFYEYRQETLVFNFPGKFFLSNIKFRERLRKKMPFFRMGQDDFSKRNSNLFAQTSLKTAAV